MTKTKKISIFRKRLLHWFAANGRTLPWRGISDPWLILVSEFMLQQTQVGRVIPKFLDFSRRWPTPAAFADATLAEVLIAWQGLGYNRRGRNLWLAAKDIVAHHRGVVPSDEASLLALPGVGAYTAAAVAAFAFNKNSLVVDTNVRRVVSRYFFGGEYRDAVDDDTFVEVVRASLPRGRASAWYAALMDFGALVCVSRKPACATCTLAKGCAAARLAGKTAPKRRFVRPPSAFKGSRRETRGIILRTLASTTSPMPLRNLAETARHADFTAIVEELEHDGLIRRAGGVLSLP